MRIPLAIFMAVKYLKPQRSLVSIVTLISTIGVMLGVSVLIIVLSIMNGFQNEWRNKIIDFNTHMHIYHQSGEIVSWENICQEIDSIEGVNASSPLLNDVVLITANEKFIPSSLNGIDYNKEEKMNRIYNKIIGGSFSLSSNEIILGSGLARALNVDIGELVSVISRNALTNKSQLRSPNKFIVSGIFHMGMYNFDENFAYISLSDAQNLYDVGPIASSLQVMLIDPINMSKVESKIPLIADGNFYSETWEDTNKVMFDALKMEKTMMFFLLIFIALIAAFSITNTLITLTIQKTKEIGLLKAIGISNFGIISIFILMGLFQGLIGLSFGIGLALVVLNYRIQILQFISETLNIDILPAELYLLDLLPSQTTLLDISIVSLLVLSFCILSGVIPSIRAATMTPVKALRFE